MQFLVLIPYEVIEPDFFLPSIPAFFVLFSLEITRRP
jgi:hypothetical protein